MDTAPITALIDQRRGSASLLEFAKAKGLPYDTLSKVMRGERKMGLEVVRVFADAFRTDPEVMAALAAYCNLDSIN